MFLKGCETKKKHGQLNSELKRKKKHVDIGSAASKGFVVFCSNVGVQLFFIIWLAIGPSISTIDFSMTLVGIESAAETT